MKSLTQREIILFYLRDNYKENPEQWTRAYELRGKSTKFGFCGHQADRRARELSQDGLIEHRIKDGYAEYKYSMMGLESRMEPIKPMIEAKKESVHVSLV